MQKKTISIVIIAYNVEQYIGRCIESVIKQSENIKDIVVVDDGSTDGTTDIIKEFCCYEKINLIHQKNMGAGGARNTGFMACQGEYVYFIDGDDYILDSTMNNLNKILNKEKQLDVIHCRMSFFDNENDQLRKDSIMLETDTPMSGMDYYVQTYKKFKKVRLGARGLYRVNFLKENELMFSNLICSEDTEWMIRVLINANRVLSNCNADYCYRDNRRGSLTSSYNIKKGKDELTALEKINNHIDNMNTIPIFHEICRYDIGKRYIYIFTQYTRFLGKEDVADFVSIVRHYIDFLDYIDMSDIRLVAIRGGIDILGLETIARILNKFFGVRIKRHKLG